MVALKRMLRVLKRTGTIKIFFVYLAVLGIGGLVLRFIEPGIHGFFEGVYYCFIASSTVGFIAAQMPRCPAFMYMTGRSKIVASM